MDTKLNTVQNWKNYYVDTWFEHD